MNRRLPSPLLMLALALPALALSSCASAPPPADPASPVARPGTCQAEPVQWAVGQPAEQATMARVWRESGAGLIRPIGPKQAVTRDYRPDRVNVELDAANVITRISCG
jgi:hypothetical protein